MKGIRDVLVPVDGSDTSSRAVDFSIGLAKYSGAGLLFCHAVDTTGIISGCANPYGLLDVEPILEALEKQCAAYLREAVGRSLGAAEDLHVAPGLGPHEGAADVHLVAVDEDPRERSGPRVARVNAFVLEQ